MNKHSGTILISPRITEKAAYLSQVGAYVFNVAPSATKREVAIAVRDVYKVTPRRVTLARIARKQAKVRGSNRTAYTAGGKKAYVYLKKGETIELS